MKTSLTAALLFLMVLSFSVAWGQVQVTGHVSAEVVEYTDASFSGESHFQINRHETSSLVNIGNINISGKPRLLCNFSMESCTVKNKVGDEFIVQTLSNQTAGFITTNERGIQGLKLSATTDDLPAGDQYSGNYNIVFAYN